MEHIQKDDIIIRKGILNIWTATQDILAYPVSFWRWDQI